MHLRVSSWALHDLTHATAGMRAHVTNMASRQKCTKCAMNRTVVPDGHQHLRRSQTPTLSPCHRQPVGSLLLVAVRRSPGCIPSTSNTRTGFDPPCLGGHRAAFQAPAVFDPLLFGCLHKGPHCEWRDKH